MHHLFQSVPHTLLSFRVHTGCSLVQDEHARAVGQRSRETDELLLTSGEGGAALSHFLLVSTGQRGDEVGQIHLSGGALDILQGHMRAA